MPQHIFYSWQADMATAAGKNLIGRALRDAIAILNADADVEDADRDDEEMAVLDQDTAGVPGSPPIVQTIFEKIDRAAAFVSDLTYVADRKDGRKSPNPNVLFEHGWAWKSLSWRAVISVMNVAHGNPNDHPLPFDLQHARGPIFFDCPDDAPVDRRRAVRDELAKALAPRLRAILDDDVLRAARVPPAPAEPHPHDLDVVRRWRALLDEPFRRFLREQNFGDAYPRKGVAPLHEIHETWEGAQFELDDPELQQPFQAFLRANSAFCRLLVERTHVMDTNIAFAWPKTNFDRERGMQPETLDAIARLNELAGRLSATIGDFDRATRARIRVPIEAAAEAAAEAMPALPDWARERLADLAADRMCGCAPRIVSRPCLSVRLVPFAAREGKRLDPRAIAQAQLRFPPNPEDRVEENSDARQWWSCAVPTPVPGMNPEMRWLVRLVRPGLIEAEATIGWREDEDTVIVVDGIALESLFVEWTERLAALVAEIGLEGGGLVELSLDGVEDVVLRRARPGGRSIGTPRLTLATIAAHDLTAPLSPLMHEAFDIMWQAAGWREGSPSFQNGEWSGRR